MTMSAIRDRVYRVFADTPKVQVDDEQLIRQVITAVHGEKGDARLRLERLLRAYGLQDTAADIDPKFIDNVIAAVRGCQ